MNNARLLHAAARGARIQERLADIWFDVSPRLFHFNDEEYFLRIHPEDAHLAYGPISTALRDSAKSGVWDGDLKEITIKVGFILSDADNAEFSYWSGEMKLTYILFLAETLADEGL